jgi:hypothetical protein
VLSIYWKRNPLIFPSTLYNKELNTTDATKYLGVTISKGLKYHINKSKQLIVIHQKKH